jgi:hypothetical protein
MDANQPARVRNYRLRPVEELWSQTKQTRSQASYAKTLEAKRHRYATDEAYREQKKQAALAAKDIRRARYHARKDELARLRLEYNSHQRI